MLIASVGLLAVIFLGWVLWTASAHARPPVSAQVSSYRVLSDQEVRVTVTVQRPDPAKAVVCQVVAQAADFQQVGALDQLAVAPRTERVVDVTTTIKTFRRASSASVKSCSLA